MLLMKGLKNLLIFIWKIFLVGFYFLSCLIIFFVIALRAKSSHIKTINFDGRI